jgi:monoamine oxidase
MSTLTLKIGIAGAGIAGLRAGIHLQQAGHTVQIFESRSNPGGRIQSLKVNGYLVEAGPEFIQEQCKETLGLLDKYRISYRPAEGKMYHVNNGRIKETYGMAKGWDQLLKKMKNLDADLPLGEFIETYFHGNRFSELRKSAIRFAEGFDLADSQTVSTKALAREWALEDSGQFRITGGYSTLIHAMAEEFCSLGGEILFEHVVESVVWYPGDVRISVRGHQPFHMDKLIVGLPLSMLNRSAPQIEQVYFFPSLNDLQKEFSKIGFGTAVKIILIWDSPFWNMQAPEALFIFSDGFIPTWWTPFPQELPLLTGWLGGPAAGLSASEPDEFFLEKSLESLSLLFSIPITDLRKKLKDYRIFNWKNMAWSRGAYSYSRVGAETAKTLGRKSLESRIYFTGEAFYDGPLPGTVEAALISGLDTASLLTAEMK